MVKKKRRNSRVRKVNTTNWGQRGTSIPMAATLMIPSGKCPYIMEEYSRQNVIDWIVNLTEEKASVVTYQKSVYTYWLRDSFDVFSQEHRDARAVVEEIVPDTVKDVQDLML